MKCKKFPTGKWYTKDCLRALPRIKSASIDLIICDLPYGTTKHKWDSIIPLELLWREYWRVLKPNGVIVLTAAMPFTAALVSSQLEHFSYEWIWRKNSGSGFASAKYQPLRYHESILVFKRKGTKGHTYNPQPTPRLTEASKRATQKPITGNSKQKHAGAPVTKVTVQYDSNNKYPETILNFNSVPNGGGKKLHPTQKPVDLIEYIIRTYTDPEELVLDNTAGSGTTAVAAINTNRRWICMENNIDYADRAKDRITKCYAALGVD